MEHQHNVNASWWNRQGPNSKSGGVLMKRCGTRMLILWTGVDMDSVHKHGGRRVPSSSSFTQQIRAKISQRRPARKPDAALQTANSRQRQNVNWFLDVSAKQLSCVWCRNNVDAIGEASYGGCYTRSDIVPEVNKTSEFDVTICWNSFRSSSNRKGNVLT